MTKDCFAAIVGVSVVQRPSCCGWLGDSSSIMLTWVGCVCCGVIVGGLSSICACGGNSYFCFTVILMALDWVSLVFVCKCCLLVLVVYCLSSGSRMRCGVGGFGSGFVLWVFCTDLGCL